MNESALLELLRDQQKILVEVRGLLKEFIAPFDMATTPAPTAVPVQELPPCTPDNPCPSCREILKTERLDQERAEKSCGCDRCRTKERIRQKLGIGPSGGSFVIAFERIPE